MDDYFSPLRLLYPWAQAVVSMLASCPGLGQIWEKTSKGEQHPPSFLEGRMFLSGFFSSLPHSTASRAFLSRPLLAVVLLCLPLQPFWRNIGGPLWFLGLSVQRGLPFSYLFLPCLPICICLCRGKRVFNDSELCFSYLAAPAVSRVSLLRWVIISWLWLFFSLAVLQVSLGFKQSKNHLSGSWSQSMCLHGEVC